ncbi:hypothetical protein BpHYR1_033342 [Brachionus plicatilis]|uniref:Uncharacterized protein n=1 Tax=Brachionus plicatilis TaxID=10195 RepID=A0A3M7PCW6_BRAPC|nr:hypothetical protein BpHYR1_033342 [Brachionus plicatilis]
MYTNFYKSFLFPKIIICENACECFFEYELNSNRSWHHLVNLYCKFYRLAMKTIKFWNYSIFPDYF